MTAESGISISVGLDTSPFQKDLTAFRTVSEKAGKQVAQALENSVSPTKITKGFNDLARSINVAAAAGKNLGASINVSGLDSLAKQAGISATGLDKMYQSMVKTAQDRAFIGSLRDIQKLTGAGNDEMNRLAKELGGVGNEFSKTSDSVGAFNGVMGTAIKWAAAIFAAEKMKEFSIAAFTAAARYETLGVVVRQVGQISGYSAVEIDKYVSNLRRMGIAGTEARQTLAQLLQAQVDLSNTPALARIAQDAAVIGGINSSEAFSRLVYGIQSAQVDVLRTIGLNVNFEQSYAKVAAQLGKSTEALTEQEKVQARLGTVMEAGARIAGSYETAMSTVGKQISSLSRLHQDFLSDFGGFSLAIASQTDAIAKYSTAVESASGALTYIRGALSGIDFETLNVAARSSVQTLRDLVDSQMAASTEAQGFNRQLSMVSAQLSTADFTFFKNQIADIQKQFESGALGIDAYRREIKSLKVVLNAQATQPAEDAPKPDVLGIKGQVSDLRAFYNKSTSGKRAGEIEELKKRLDQARLLKGELGSEYGQIRAGLQKDLESLLKVGQNQGLEGRQFKWDLGLDQLRKDVADMEATINPAALGLEKIRNKLQNELDKAKNAANRKAEESIHDKVATPAEAETRKNLEIRKAELTYTQKLAEAEEKGRQTRVEFYKDFAELSGNYTESLQAQAEAIARQGEEYRNAGIPEQLERQWEALKKLQTARDPMSGTVRGLRKYANEATDLAKGMEDVWGNAFKGMEDAIVTFAQTGKMSFTDMANSIIADLIRIAVRSSITGPLASGLGSLFSGWGSSIQTTGASSSWASFGVTPGASMALAKGGAVGGGSISDYSNSIVTRPTYFSYGVRAFARGGAGLMGEAGDEGVFPLSRDSRGNLAVSATGLADIFKAATSGYGSSNQQTNQPQVYLNINNSTGEQVAQQVKTDNNGNIRADIWVGNTAAKQMAKPGTAANQTLRSGLGIKQRAIGR